MLLCGMTITYTATLGTRAAICHLITLIQVQGDSDIVTSIGFIVLWDSSHFSSNCILVDTDLCIMPKLKDTFYYPTEIRRQSLQQILQSEVCSLGLFFKREDLHWEHMVAFTIIQFNCSVPNDEMNYKIIPFLLKISWINIVSSRWFQSRCNGGTGHILSK